VALRSAKFREVVQQVTAALEDRGISVPDPGVAEIVEERARQVAKQAGMSVRQVLEHADPQQLAARIAEVIHQGEFAVRPPRDTVPVQIAVSRIPALIGGLSETGKLAASNSDANRVRVALDVITHLATILHMTIANTGHIDADRTLAEVERGLLIEAASVMTTASGRLSAAEWSTCPCGTEHGQGKIDKALARALLGQANEIDKLLTVVLRRAIWRSFGGAPCARISSGRWAITVTRARPGRCVICGIDCLLAAPSLTLTVRNWRKVY
jgi:hypothetical protein